MSLGTPVMTSKAASLTEVAGDAALPVDPLDIRAMTKIIQKIDADSDLRADLGRRGAERAKLFSPEAYRRRIGAPLSFCAWLNSIHRGGRLAKTSHYAWLDRPLFVRSYPPLRRPQFSYSIGCDLIASPVLRDRKRVVVGLWSSTSRHGKAFLQNCLTSRGTDACNSFRTSIYFR